MKKFMNILLVLAFVLCANCAAMAAEDIGVVDVTLVWDKYQKSVNVSKVADEKDVELEKFLLDKKRLIAQGATPVERKNLEDKYAKEFQVKVEEAKKWYAQEQQTLETNVMNAIKTVAAQKCVAVVLSKKTAIYGGVDITNDVIMVLNK